PAVGEIRLGSFLGAATGPDDAGGWLGTNSEHPLHLYTNDGLPQVTLNTSGNLGIGTMVPDARLHVAGGFKLEDGTQADKRILTSDADGNASWQRLNAESLFGNGSVPAPDLSCMGEEATVSIGSEPSAVVVSNDHAFALTGLYSSTGELTVIDLGNPAVPIDLGSMYFGFDRRPYALAVSGNYVYVTGSFGPAPSIGFFLTIDISNPSTPTFVSGSEFLFGVLPISVVVSGNYAFVVDNFANDMKVIDISDPAAPALVPGATVALGTGQEAVAFSGDHAYVISSSSDNLKVIDISDPTTPVLLPGSVILGSSPRGMAISGNHVYVVDIGSDDLKVIDISDPAAPALLPGSLALGQSPGSIAVIGNYAYVGDFTDNDLKVIDISDPAAPVLSADLGGLNVAARTAVAGSGNYAYVLDPDLGSEALTVIKLFCATPLGYDPVSGEFGPADESDPQVGSITTGYLPRWSGTELVTGSVFDNGNVGIGTSAPIRRLQIHDSNGGTIKPAVKIKVHNCGVPCISQPETTQALSLQNSNGSAGNAVGIGFADNDQDELPSAWIGTRLANKTLHYGDLLFHTRGGGGFGERMRITSIGNVGIGTTSPGAELEVNGYTKLGSDAPAIRMKEFTGTTPSTAGDGVSIPTGIPADNVISVSVWVQRFTTIWEPPHQAAPYYYSYWASGTDIYIRTEAGLSNSMLNKAVRVIVTYKE
ncbi:MAG: hypothetical protein KDB88_03545, partial [Flavobacteriales bacterium]|nr:hypothetical protein [Flavobacteriales bacterium]